MKLKKISKGVYQTEDGLYNIEHHDDYETECLEPHPCRIKVSVAKGGVGITPVAKIPERYRIFGNITRAFTKEGHVEYFNYYCEGDEIHYESRWIVWCNGGEIDGKWVDGDYPRWTGPNGFDTKKDAVGSLEYHLAFEKRLDESMAENKDILDRLA